MDNSYKITPKQLSYIKSLIKKAGWDDGNEAIKSYSKNKINLLSDLSKTEAARFIKQLLQENGQDNSDDRMRKKIIGMAHEMNWVNGNNVNMTRVNDWCINSGMFKKPLQKHNTKELSRLVGQFEKVKKSFIKSVTTNG